MKYNKKFYNSVGTRALISSEIVFSEMKKWYFPLSITDFGAGPGVWSSSAAKSFPKARVLAIDYSGATIFQDEFKEHKPSNLNTLLIDFETTPVDNLDEIDLGICLEVLEHLQPETANDLFSVMCEKSQVILFSAAVPGQGGTGHINERPKEYWVQRFRDRDFLIFDVFKEDLTSPAVPSYYRNNIFLAVRRSFILDSTNFDAKKFLQKLGENRVSENRSIRLRLAHSLIRLLPSKIVTLLARIAS